jgi:hypothetical protein
MWDDLEKAFNYERPKAALPNITFTPDRLGNSTPGLPPSNYIYVHIKDMPGQIKVYVGADAAIGDYKVIEYLELHEIDQSGDPGY